MQDIKQAIKETYGATALNAEHTQEGAKRVAQAFGYTKEELEAVPQGSNMGLSCGNPTAIAGLREGEVVVDLGSGGGLDCFLAARKVGDSGRVIGVDMTPNMIELARNNATKAGKTNVEFRLGEIEALPIEDNSVHCVISNCVINLSTDKQKVFNEVFRVLKPNGRLAVSDICLKKELPSEVMGLVTAYVGCVAGATSVEKYCDMMRQAGFSDIDIVSSNTDLGAYALLSADNGALPCCAGGSMTSPASTSSGGSCILGDMVKGVAECCGPSYPSSAGCGSSSGASKGFSGEMIKALLRKYDINEYVGSYKIFAIKSSS